MGKLKAPKIKKIAFDDGLLSDGFLTRDATLRLEGKAQAGAKLTLFDNGVKIGKAKADKKGAWSFDTAALADGVHAFKAKAKVGKGTSPFSKEIGGGVDDMLHFSNAPHPGFTGADRHRNLVIQGDAGDHVRLYDFDAGGSLADYCGNSTQRIGTLRTPGAGDYDLYNLVRDGKVIASVAVESDVTVL